MPLFGMKGMIPSRPTISIIGFWSDSAKHVKSETTEDPTMRASRTLTVHSAKDGIVLVDGGQANKERISELTKRGTFCSNF